MSQKRQTLILDKDCRLLYSCDSLFNTDLFKNDPLTLHFPFLESIFFDLLKKLKPDLTIYFPGVATKHAFLPGYYEYCFSLTIYNKTNAIQWEILDVSEEYTQIKTEQQSSNENNISPKDLP